MLCVLVFEWIDFMIVYFCFDFWFFFFFFFSSRRRHTRSLRDWSSDVCSSDLQLACAPLRRQGFVVLAIPRSWHLRGIHRRRERDPTDSRPGLLCPHTPREH